MDARTYAYFGDGVYAEFDGFNIVLHANGLPPAATDSICLEPDTIAMLTQWIDKGCPDHNSGIPFNTLYFGEKKL